MKEKKMTKSSDGFMADYNFFDWSKFMVREPKDRPAGSHYAAVLFETRTEYIPPYDQRDCGTSITSPEIHYFAFPDKKTLESWLLRATKANKNFFFFEVKKIGDVKLSVSIGTDL